MANTPRNFLLKIDPIAANLSLNQILTSFNEMNGVLNSIEEVEQEHQDFILTSENNEVYKTINLDSTEDLRWCREDFGICNYSA